MYKSDRWYIKKTDYTYKKTEDTYKKDRWYINKIDDTYKKTDGTNKKADDTTPGIFARDIRHLN
jgi:hypothetical protein